MMKAAVLVAPQRFALRDVPMPAIGPEDALIRVRRTGICGRRLRLWAWVVTGFSLNMWRFRRGW